MEGEEKEVGQHILMQGAGSSRMGLKMVGVIALYIFNCIIFYTEAINHVGRTVEFLHISPSITDLIGDRRGIQKK
jgi:hypothetical protein